MASSLTNPAAIKDKALIERLCEKSKILYGAKWAWRKRADSRGATAQEMEVVIDKIIEFIEKGNKKE